MNRSQLRDALAINDLKRNIFDIEGKRTSSLKFINSKNPLNLGVIQKLPNSYPGPSWKFPQRQAKDIDVEEQSARFSAGEDVMENFHAQLSLLELLVDRIHFLILSCADVQVYFIIIVQLHMAFLVSFLHLYRRRWRIPPQFHRQAPSRRPIRLYWRPHPVR